MAQDRDYRKSALGRLLEHEASGGVLLMFAALAAMMIANSALAPLYQGTLRAYFAVTLNGAGVEKPLILWINDGLMAIFFFLIGLELKREILIGKLKNPRDVILPGMAAVGGMAVPALIYAWINWGNPETLRGWAIPAATDIAFALGILALVGSRAPASLKVFLLTLAILDDLGAILIIAIFYTAELDVNYLYLAVIPLAGLLLYNIRGTHALAPAIILGTIMWFLVLESGVHATLAGVITAFFVPLRDRYGASPLESAEHGLEPWVNYMILPIFAFANAGVVMAGIAPIDLLNPVPLGIAAGLLVGKIVGVMGICWLIVTLGFATLPRGAGWMHVFGVACLAGIGFTMSLFIGSLSFPSEMLNDVRLGVLSGSIVAGLLGYAVLRMAPRATADPQEEEPAGQPITDAGDEAVARAR